MAGLLVFIIDALTPLGYAPWFFYVVLLSLYIIYTDKKYITALASFYTILLIPGYYLSPPATSEYYIPIINRVAAALIMLLLAILGLRDAAVKKISAEILERIKDLFIAVDKNFKITFFNKSAMLISGLRENPVGRDIYEVFPVLQNELIQSRINTAFISREPVNFQYSLRVSKNILDITLYGSEKGISVFARDITEKVRAERKLTNLLHEKDMLMREMHHRTKNNFQLVLSLLNLQISTIQDELAIKILNETRGRLLSITILYDKLYRSGNFYTVAMESFISEIIEGMETAANFGMIKMHNELKIEDARIGIEAAIPIGLIINELYTNSIKYAFDGSMAGSILVEMKFIDQNTLFIRYKDNGKGLPENFNLENGGLGSSIISGFVAQLDGEISHRNNKGAEFEMKLKVTKNQKTAEIPKPDIAAILNTDKK